MSYWTFNGTINGHQYSRSNISNAEVLANESGQRVEVGHGEFEQFSGSVTPNGNGSLSINGVAHMSGLYNGDLQTNGTLTQN